MRILVVCNRTALMDRMNPNIFYNLEALRNHADVCFVGQGCDVLDSLDKFQPHLVYYAGDVGDTDFSSVKEIKLPKILYMEDYWADLDERLGVLQQGDFDFLVTKNAPCVNFYLEKFPRLKHILNPHGYNPNIFHPENLEKKWDFTICGRIDDRYRLRKRVSELAGNLERWGYRVNFKPHPGYRERGEVQTDDGQPTLARICNESKVVLGGTGTGNQCHMAKIWEISATSAVCFTDANPLDGDYDKIKTHVALCDMNWDDEKILDTMKSAIDNWQASRFYSLFVRYATIDERAKQLVRDFKRHLEIT